MHFLPLALFSCIGIAGWLLGRRHPRKRSKQKQDFFSKDYFVGLNYLLNEQPDQAVDFFIRMLEVNNNTVETHMALGSLFRRRGETERAIRIHQNLIARPNLGKDLRVQALQELGRDYMIAGMFDRAERLFLEAVEAGSCYQVQSLHYLMDIYEHEKDWFSALETAQKLQKQTGKNKGYAIAQYYCEIIEDPRNHLAANQIIEYLRLAHQADKHCVRVTLLRAKQESKQGNDKEAIKLYERLAKQESAFNALLLPLLEQTYQKLGDEKGFVDYLYKSLDENAQPELIILLAEKLQLRNGSQAAIDFLLKQLSEHPSLLIAESLLHLQTKLLDGEMKEKCIALKNCLRHLMIERTGYLCEHCGFSGKKLHWLCPSCRRWGTIKPISEVKN